ncbi:hypothetical protein JHK87_050553 [Glycine soja]|nr:hypothetical protein JHK87_050553 [Glycine soja]
MKLDEDLSPNREDDFQTNDEENQAQRVFEHLDEDTDSDNSPPSGNLSNEISIISWPQNYSVAPTGVIFLRRIDSIGRGMLLIRCLESKLGLKTYPDIGQVAFGIVGHLGIAVSIIMIACKHQIIILTNSSKVSKGFFITIVLYFTHFIFQIYLLTIITFVLSWRNICINSCCIYLFWVGIIDQVDGYKPGEKTLDLSNIFVSIGLYSFYFVGHAVFPNIYSSMKEPSKFPLVLYIYFSFCDVMYISVGIMGFLTFDDSFASQFNISVVTPLAKYALTLLPIALSI